MANKIRRHKLSPFILGTAQERNQFSVISTVVPDDTNTGMQLVSYDMKYHGINYKFNKTMPKHQRNRIIAMREKS